MDIEGKIRALLTKTVKNGCTPAEAASARALAERLCRKHNLQIASVAAAPTEQPDFGFSAAATEVWRAYCAQEALRAAARRERERQQAELARRLREWAQRDMRRERARAAAAAAAEAERLRKDAELEQFRRAARRREAALKAARTRAGYKAQTEELVCRYCGSADLAPSFIKRRDRRCRKCFSERYGSRNRRSA